MPLSVEEKAAGIEAIIFDVDGVLTSGAIIYGPDAEWKVFHVQDGHGFKLAIRAGLRIGALTGRSSPIVERRMSELGVTHLEQNVKTKAEALPRFLEALNASADKVCYVGDDLVDIPVMRKVGLAVAVANAVEEVKVAADWVTTKKGGKGAAREVIELVLKSRGLWQDLMKRYVEDA